VKLQHKTYMSSSKTFLLGVAEWSYEMGWETMVSHPIS
jgi:hypothetical protein